MTLQEHIAQLETDHRQALEQIRQWTETRLRTEGAILVLRKIVEEEQQAADMDVK